GPGTLSQVLWSSRRNHGRMPACVATADLGAGAAGRTRVPRRVAVARRHGQRSPPCWRSRRFLWRPPPPPQPSPPRPRVRGGPPATLVLQGVPVTPFYASLGDLTPAQRAATARERLEKLRPPHLGDSIRVQPVSGARLLLVGPTLAFTVLEEDVPPDSGLTIDQAAQNAREGLARALKARAALWAPNYWLRALLNLVIATAVLILLILLLI